jgi:phage FluMu gp28-like protein
LTKFEIKLHQNQIQIFKAPERFKIAITGRRFGKTYLAAYSIILSALKKQNGVYFVVSPSYAQTKIIWRMIKRFLPREYIKKIMEGELYIELVNGSLIFAKSGDNPSSLRGEGLDGVVLDEAAFLHPDVWNEAIRPALADKMGWAIIISSPKGKNWLYELFLRGLDDTQPDYASFRFSSFDNPLVPPSEIEEMSRNLPELSYKQEILASFIEGGGVVFRNVDKVMRGYPEEPIPGVFYIMGVDLGRHEDFTVISVARTDQNRQVYLEKFNRTDWDYIKDRVRDVHFKYNNAPIIIDSTGYGDPIYEDLGKEGLNITGININVASKPKMIENLQLMIENGMIVLINDNDASLEFSAYSYTILPSGNVRYEAARSFHDDIVMATALMAMGLQGSGSDLMGEVAEVEDSPDAEVYNEIEDIEDWDDFNYDD